MDRIPHQQALKRIAGFGSNLLARIAPMLKDMWAQVSESGTGMCARESAPHQQALQ